MRYTSPLTVAGLACLLYIGTLGGEFVWDDIPLIAQNEALRSLKNVPKALTSDFSGLADPSKRSGYYRPVTLLTYFLDHHLWRGRPFGFHLSNALLHAICSLFVYLLSLDLLNSKRAALAAGLLFASHPVHTEAVAWISGRTDILATLFLLASLLTLRRSYPTSLILSLLCMGSKESGISVTFLAPLYGTLLSRRISLKYLGYVVLGAGFWALRCSIVGGVRLPPDVYVPPLILRIADVPVVWGRYIYKLIWPFRLSAEWDIPLPSSIGPHHILGWLMSGALGYLLLKRWRDDPSTTLGFGLLLLGLLPVSGVIPLYDRVAERFLYLPSVGFVILLARATSGLRRVSIAWAAICLVLLPYSWTTLRRNQIWRDQETLFRSTVRDAPNSARAHYNLGTYLLGRGNYDEAIKFLRKALALRPGFKEAQYNIACAYALKGDREKAISALARAVRMGVEDPKFVAEDPDLKPLHKDPRFWEILKRMGLTAPGPIPSVPPRSP
ncbi:MAG TPA: tetratricopeptide repeat protein [Candidatus Latescibacteria bacterium]|nr:tetratricopeptide repeat protein [Candidatus Latescibacterota bacterium]